MRKICLTILLLVVLAPLSAEVPIVAPKLSENTGIAPAYFGPNALPVPDMLDGRVQGALRVELAADGYFGYQKDLTADLFAKINIPLWTDRVNLSVWMPVMEWYRMTPERQRTCRLQDQEIISGHEAGDVYVSTDIQLLKARKYTPDIAFRAALKTASGGSFDKARYFDDPGYWFDLAVGKSMYIGQGVSAIENEHSMVELRLAGSLGFLCWQTDNGRQNDALLYGVQLFAKAQYVSLRATWGGYMGWEKDGDRPMTVKVQVSGHAKGFEPFEVDYHHYRSGFLNAVAYTDSCLGAFVDTLRTSPAWDSTLLVLIADHGYPYPEGVRNYEPQRYRIPLIFAGGAVKQPRVISTLCSQIDWLPTLLHQMQLDASDFIYAKDILSSEHNAFAYYNFVDGFAYIDSTGTTVIDAAVNKPLIETQPADDRANKAKAFTQYIMTKLSE